MTIPEILKELEPYTGRFPLEAMQAAIEQREAITPELLRVAEASSLAPSNYPTHRAPHTVPPDGYSSPTSKVRLVGRSPRKNMEVSNTSIMIL